MAGKGTVTREGTTAGEGTVTREGTMAGEETAAKEGTVAGKGTAARGVGRLATVTEPGGGHSASEPTDVFL